MINKKNYFYPTLLLLTYIIIIAITYLTFKDHGVHIEEKFHRLNGLFWLKYVSDLFGNENLSMLVDLEIKIFQITLLIKLVLIWTSTE